MEFVRGNAFKLCGATTFSLDRRIWLSFLNWRMGAWLGQGVIWLLGKGEEDEQNISTGREAGACHVNKRRKMGTLLEADKGRGEIADPRSYLHRTMYYSVLQEKFCLHPRKAQPPAPRAPLPNKCETRAGRKYTPKLRNYPQPDRVKEREKGNGEGGENSPSTVIGWWHLVKG